MVSDVQTPALADADLDIGDADLEGFADASPEAEVDPVAALREELAALQSEVSELRPLRMLNPEQINRALGHVPALQRDFAELKKGPSGPDPIAAIDPRLSESEDVLAELVDALSASEYLDDGAKAALRQRKQRMESNRSERSATKLRRELLAEVQGARETVQEAQPDTGMAVQVQLAVATSELRGYAAAKGVDFDTLPPNVLFFTEAEQKAAERGDFSGPLARVRGEINTLAGESAGTERVANRRRAAGAGAPASAGAGAYRTQTAISTAHANGQLSTAQVKAMRDSGQFAALPFQ